MGYKYLDSIRDFGLDSNEEMSPEGHRQQVEAAAPKQPHHWLELVQGMGAALNQLPRPAALCHPKGVLH